MRVLLTFVALAFMAACDMSSGSEGAEDVVQYDGAGTCAPILKHDEFVILAWYELIDINAASLR